ncbi:hypothetical protein [Sporosarcina jiandibaonis]|uniref:hypothetical protein n=1 Tax=Sporosarcina jiandibaonis TaxID=2715535 RepID=UPI0015581B8D|nr:hypothetical protein [Sporosarcina jiandibaonis]
MSIGSFVKPSRESEKKIIIQDLNLLGIYETVKGEALDTLSYYSLRTLLAVEQAVRT